MGCGTDGWGRPLQNIRLHVTAGCRETFGKRQERESNRLVALGSFAAGTVRSGRLLRGAGGDPGKSSPRHRAGPDGGFPGIHLPLLFWLLHPLHGCECTQHRAAGAGLTPPALPGVRIPAWVGYRSPGGDVTPGETFREKLEI